MQRKCVPVFDGVSSLLCLHSHARTAHQAQKRKWENVRVHVRTAAVAREGGADGQRNGHVGRRYALHQEARHAGEGLEAGYTAERDVERGELQAGIILDRETLGRGSITLGTRGSLLTLGIKGQNPKIFVNSKEVMCHEEVHSMCRVTGHVVMCSSLLCSVGC